MQTYLHKLTSAIISVQNTHQIKKSKRLLLKKNQLIIIFTFEVPNNCFSMCLMNMYSEVN